MDGATKTRKKLDPAEIGAIAHLYRGEVYRSTIWRTRLDTTTNWSVVTLGVALSITYSSPQASPLPLVLVGILIIFFLMLEARRYRYFNVWRARCRWMELHFYAPMLKEGDLHLEEHWQDRLADDYLHPHYHVSMWTAIGRRIRRNYFWILLIQSAAYLGKLIVHPTPLDSTAQLFERAAIGPFPGWLILLIGGSYCLTWGAIALMSELADTRRARARSDPLGMG
ncbi:DUF2270 domain-containing protein [Paracoccus sp. SCSIO 75233]|uniref:DUF2270 domain-containing protein n=1 Tax=Paracoccus sp. SCSIO 75233 TaxID=3017782 RepID=UPI0022F12046|nr:DUF2270 domain-containing protein [Paracoccus sp. SCSIO 75233]WBU52377.1 DUF2270 domain-containing protein [Paracoccus sp. SCSIO 75233]